MTALVERWWTAQRGRPQGIALVGPAAALHSCCHLPTKSCKASPAPTFHGFRSRSFAPMMAEVSQRDRHLAHPQRGRPQGSPPHSAPPPHLRILYGLLTSHI